MFIMRYFHFTSLKSERENVLFQFLLLEKSEWYFHFLAFWPADVAGDVSVVNVADDAGEVFVVNVADVADDEFVFNAAAAAAAV